jgi:metallo-beta-lactamase family protein
MPLYNTADVEASLPHFQTIETLTPCKLNQHVEFQLYPGGHILGTCSIAFNCYGKVIVFSGDIGRPHSELLPAPTHAKKADFVVMESTYGDRCHASGDPAEEMAKVIADAVWQKGNVLIPCFAVGRAQEIMHVIYRLKKQNKIPVSIPVYLDSPMAASAGRILKDYPEWVTIDEKECSKMFSGVTINQDYHGTEQIIRRKGSKIILAASGMMTGGRVLEYLKHYITDPKNTLLIIGYQAEGTRGRALLNGASEIKIHGQYYAAKARVEEIGGLSAHADQSELINWLKTFEGPPSQVFLVHGEPGAQDALRVKIKDTLGIRVTILKQDQCIYLFDVGETEYKHDNDPLDTNKAASV